MTRTIIKIDADKCNGCGLCAQACHEGAITMIEGKARLLRDDYCDGLGDCLPVCPTGAITFEEREAKPYNEAAVKEHLSKSQQKQPVSSCCSLQASSLAQWPVQIKLMPTAAPYFNHADLLIAADCTAYVSGSFHNDYMKQKITIIGCPKLDFCDYSEKLSEIFIQNTINSITVVRMEVPCCRGMVEAVKTALEVSGKAIPLTVIVLSREGTVISTEQA